MATAYAIASLIPDEELTEDYIIPSALNKDVAKVVAEAVVKAARGDRRRQNLKGCRRGFFDEENMKIRTGK